MKKSTLITTIAMIVVVVVALSTATYAWFTSSSTATTSGHITVTSDAGWVIMGTSGNAMDELVTTTENFAYNDQTSLTMNMLNGLFSPTAAISSVISSNDESCSMTNIASWYEATQVGIGEKGTATINDTPSIDPKDSTDAYPTAANYIRVVNTYSEPKYLTLTITVKIATSSSNVQRAAAQQLCTYASINNQGDSYIANTAYDYGTVTDSTASKAEAVGYRSVGPSTGSGKYEIGGSTGFVSTSATNLDTKYTGGATETDGTNSYYQLYIDMGQIQPTGAVNIGIYIWFNGWKIDSSANGAEADIYLAFGETPAGRIPVTP